jgi:ABC-type sulfate/molybdate transport systems, ATPase component
MSLVINIQKQLKGLSLNINLDTNGAPIGFLGASGSGKSITLKCIAGIETPDSGKIILNDKILFDSEKGINLKPQQRKIGFLFQSYALFPNMTVRENVEIVVKQKENKKHNAEQLLSLLRISHLKNRYPHQISGGEQQRVALARIMACEPELMMFDEPFSALDLFLKDQLQQEIYETLKEYQGEFIMVSHSREELYRFCDNIVVISQGKTIETGKKKDIFSNPSDITTAKLTGCKNLSRAKKLSDHEVRALDWNLTLHTEQYVEEEIRFVGIRAHNLKPCYEDRGLNSFSIALAGFSEGPFENNIMIHNSFGDGNAKLWWIVSKKEWKNSMKETLPKRITLPGEHLLLLRDQINTTVY